jgi:hypothetical protein
MVERMCFANNPKWSCEPQLFQGLLSDYLEEEELLS